MEETSFDPTRRLCPDGACVGVIGPDGLCSVCGRTESAAARGDDIPESTDEVPADVAPSGEAAGSASASRPASSGSPSGFDATRRLCDDGSCVGLVGADGRCGVCGRKAE